MPPQTGPGVRAGGFPGGIAVPAIVVHRNNGAI